MSTLGETPVSSALLRMTGGGGSVMMNVDYFNSLLQNSLVPGGVC